MNNNKIIRTRYAPSPTGLFHIGGARTALFNYLFAKKNKGDFILRIEDTDLERNVEKAKDELIENVKWLKLFPDESPVNPGDFGPYIQSQKIPKYSRLAHDLVKQKKAYFCFCSPEKLKKDKKSLLDNKQTPKYNKTCLNLTPEQIELNLKKGIKYSIRLDIKPNTTYSWDDLIRGEISFNSDALTDPVILKSNGIASFNFAVVIDDFDMEITHVIRGEEHISNTPYHLAIRQALGYTNEITFGHLSVVTDETGKKLSKRNIQLKQFIEDYKSMGFLSEAITNFLYLLGASPKDNEEVFSLNDAVKNFDIKKVSRSSAIFDFKKMQWISSQHFKNMADAAFVNFVAPFVTHDLSFFGDRVKDLILLFKSKITYAKEINSLIENEVLNIEKESDLIESFKKFDQKETKKLLSSLFKRLNQLVIWKEEDLKLELNSLKKEFSYLGGEKFFMPIRIALTSRTHGPELAKIIFLLGKGAILNTLKKFLKNTNFLYEQ